MLLHYCLCVCCLSPYDSKDRCGLFDGSLYWTDVWTECAQLWYESSNLNSLTGRGKLTPNCNAGAYIDNLVWQTNMYFCFSNIFSLIFRIHPNDPEGLVSTLTASVTTYLGVEFGRIFMNFKGQHKPLLLRLHLWSRYRSNRSGGWY